jgi:hypothetical protein
VLDGGFQCTGTCQSATPLARQQNSGNFGTTGERWFVVNTNINGWQASEMTGRTIRVNGTVVTPGQMPLPPAVNGLYYFQLSAGSGRLGQLELLVGQRFVRASSSPAASAARAPHARTRGAHGFGWRRRKRRKNSRAAGLGGLPSSVSRLSARRR